MTIKSYFKVAPSLSISIRSATGILGKPGIVIILPAMATNTANAYSILFFIFINGKPVVVRLYPDFELDEVALEKPTQHNYCISLAGIMTSYPPP